MKSGLFQSRNNVAYKRREMDKNNNPDTIDWKILRELQREGRLTNVDLSNRVGLSPPPTLRRVQALEEAGLITGYRAQLDRAKLDYDVKMFAAVGLKSQAQTEVEAFERRAKTWPIVRECYAVSGAADFMLVCVARDLNAMQSFVTGALSKAPNVDSVKTSLILHVAKDEPEVPLP
jgi:DNA-binding Lrp family transcriptional regulator